MSEFLSSYALWREAVLAAVATGALMGFLGVFVIARRVVFISVALSQVSAFGVAAAFIAGEWMGSSEGAGSFAVHPALWSMAFAVAASLALGAMPRSRRVTTESVIGAFYLVAAGFVLVISSRMAAHAHEIDNVLFGNAVAIGIRQLVELLVVALAVGGLFVWRLNDFLWTTFDEEGARAIGTPVGLENALFYVGVAAAISTATRTIGGLPVFAFVVLPATSALLISARVRVVLALAAGIGAASAFVGYYISFVASMPTGACMVLTASFFLIPAVAKNFLTR